MTVKTIPLTTYSIRQTNPGHKFGSPGVCPLRTGGAGNLWMLARVPLDAIPTDAVISAAHVQMWNSDAASGTFNARCFPLSEQWKSSVTYADRPASGALIGTVTKTGPAADQLWDWDVTPWTSPRSRFGLRFDVSGTGTLNMRGSSSSRNKPVLVVTYTVPADTPTNLTPQGGYVSKAQPILTYIGDVDMTQQWIEYSTDGTTAGTVYKSGWLPS